MSDARLVPGDLPAQCLVAGHFCHPPAKVTACQTKGAAFRAAIFVRIPILNEEMAQDRT